MSLKEQVSYSPKIPNDSICQCNEKKRSTPGQAGSLQGINEQTCQNERNMMNTEVNTDKLVNDLRKLTRDAEELVEATAGEVGERARDARKRLSAAVDSAHATCEALQEKAVNGAKATDKVIRDHPYQSLGIAFGVGLLIGVLVNRK
jgi:ElaB/YqjD/DUF883 family membrane-anchored ribosome-binding protein